MIFFNFVELLGLEPRTKEPESSVLPLHHSSIMLKNSIQIVGDKGLEPINLSAKNSRVIPITPIPKNIFYISTIYFYIVAGVRFELTLFGL